STSLTSAFNLVFKAAKPLSLGLSIPCMSTTTFLGSSDDVFLFFLSCLPPCPLGTDVPHPPHPTTLNDKNKPNNNHEVVLYSLLINELRFIIYKLKIIGLKYSLLIITIARKLTHYFNYS